MRFWPQIPGVAARTWFGFFLILQAKILFAANPVQVKDLHYGEILFSFYQQDYFSSIVHTMVELKLQDSSAGSALGRIPYHRDEAELLLGGLNLSYGQHRRAAEIFQNILASNPDAELRNRVWYFIGKLAYERGQYAEAENALRQIDAETVADLLPEQQLLLAQVLIRRERFLDAAAILEAWKGPADLTGYAVYNRGVALVRGGEIEQGVAVLDTLGQSDIPTGELYSLKDKTNLGLGFRLLREGEPEKSKPFLERVRLEGPFSNKALLGLGWAETEQKNYRRALVPWQELGERNLADFAVLESRVAVPYAYAKLQLHGRAVDGYKDALDAYEVEMERIENAIQAAKTGELIQNLLAQTRQANPNDPEAKDVAPPNEQTRYFVSLLSGHSFRRALRNYRELQFLQANLDSWQKGVAAFGDILATRKQAYEEALPRIRDVYAKLDLERLYSQRDRVAQKLQVILDSEDTLAAASVGQQQVYARLDAIEEKLEDLPPSPDTDDAWDKLQLLKGLVLWQLTYDYPDQQWKLRKSLKQTDAALRRTEKLIQGVEGARVVVPSSFNGYSQRTSGMQARVNELRDKIRNILTAQDQYLRRLAIAVLENYRARLATYVLQARFGLAQNYDQLATSDQFGEAVSNREAEDAAVEMDSESTGEAESEQEASGEPEETEQ